MNNKIRQDVVEIIESRMTALCAEATSVFSQSLLHGELTMAIDLAGLTEAIGLEQQRNYKERLMRIVERNSQQWPESIRWSA